MKAEILVKTESGSKGPELKTQPSEAELPEVLITSDSIKCGKLIKVFDF